MNFADMPALVRMGICLAGGMNIWLGYRFFCGDPLQTNKNGRSRGRMLIKAGSGALLAVFGTVVLVADAGGFRTRDTRYPASGVPANQLRRHAPTACEYSTDPEACRATPLRLVHARVTQGV